MENIEMGASGVLPLDSSCCNCLGGLGVNSFVSVFNFCSSRLSVWEGLQLVFDPHGSSSPEDEPHQFLKLCALCGEFFRRLLETYEEFARLTTFGSYVESLRNKLATAQAHIEEEELKPEIHLYEEPKASIPNEPASVLFQLSTDQPLKISAPVKQKSPRRVNRKQDFGKKEGIVTGIRNVIIAEEVAVPAEEVAEHAEDPLANTDDEDKTIPQIPMPRRSTRKRKNVNTPIELFPGTFVSVSTEAPSKSAFKEEIAENSDVDYNEGKSSDKSTSPSSSSDEDEGVRVRSPANKRRRTVGRTIKKPELKYSCPNCPMRFSSHVRFVIHKATHTGERPYDCSECKTNYRTELDLQKHYRRVHPGKVLQMFKCEVPGCGAEFLAKLRLEMHAGLHTGERPYACAECNTNYVSLKNLGAHNQRCHRDKVKGLPSLPDEDKALLTTKNYKCDGCTDISFESYKAWAVHQETIHALDVGYGDLSTKSTLEPTHGHIRPCPECGKKYKSNVQIVDHVKSVHLDLRPFTCDICHKSFRSKMAHKTHLESIHSFDQPQYLCVLCGVAFKMKSSLRLHEQTHMGLVINRAECEICHLKFHSKSRVRDHMNSVHSDARSFVCDQCGKDFKVLRALNQHKKLQHYKKFIKDAFCSYCGKSYAFKDKLKEHLMSVHKLSKEEARISAGMKRHGIFRVLPNGERVHKEKPTKPKTCGFCGRTYVRREQLFTHLISVHAQTPEQAKDITGLESKRNLLPGAGAGRSRRKSSLRLEEESPYS